MINRALRLTREFHRMKQGDLAKSLGISASYLSEIEKGSKPPSLELLDQYSRVFKVPASTFLLFKERANGAQEGVVNRHAQRLLNFFDWVISDEDATDGGKEEAATTAGETGKAIRTA